MMPLGLLTAGETAEVVELRAGPAAFTQKSHCGGECGRVEEMGIRGGKVVEMLNNEGRGAVLVKVDGSRIALGRKMAMKVMVRRKI